MRDQPRPEGALVGMPEIAAIAGVQRSAVSNWRKRHSDFPTPALETPSGLLFDLDLIERWLIEHGKMSTYVPTPALLWRFADALRTDWRPEEVRDFVVSSLVYLEACARARRVAGSVRVRERDRWDKLIEIASTEELASRLRAAARRIEADNEELSGLLVEGFASLGGPATERQIELVGLLSAATDDQEIPRFDLYEQVVSATHDRARFSEEFATPDDLAMLLAHLAQNAATIFDPACGEGGVLLLSATMNGDSRPEVRLVGWERNENAYRLARARFFLYERQAELRCVDSLRATDDELPRAAAVVLDPPYGVARWGDADLYLATDRWPFGTPPPGSADLAWVQLALRALEPGGRAFVLLPAGDLTKGARERDIRAAMVEAGVVEAVVLLPGRLRRDTSSPLALWCLGPGSEPKDRSILLVDASRIGVAGRSTVSLSEEEIDRLVNILWAWFDGHPPSDGDSRISTAEVQISELQEASLHPARYQRETKASRQQLLVEREEAIEQLAEAVSAVMAALDDLDVTAE
jgi:type I restriction enzyme M protein